MLRWQLEDSQPRVRMRAVLELRKLEPAALAQYANALVARLDDSEELVCMEALETLGKLEPAMLAQHTHAVLARIEDSAWIVRRMALETLGKLEPAKLAPQYADVAIVILEDSDSKVHEEALAMRHLLPRFVTCGLDFSYSAQVFGQFNAQRPRLLARLRWYRCRLRLRAQRLALYWYALPYRPSGPGHARDVEAWDRMTENQDHRVSITTAATRRKRCKAERNAGTQQNVRQTRSRSRNAKNPRRE